MLHIILAEAELETIPKELWKHRAIVKHAKKVKKKPKYILLDSSLHHAALRELKDGNRRGRPDIVHASLLNILESPLNKSKALRCYVHTRNDQIIYINPETRLPKNYNRFKGVIEKLFKDRVIEAEGKILLEMRDMDIEDLIRDINPRKIIIMDDKAEYNYKKFLELMKEDNICVIVGAFPHGDYRKQYDFKGYECERISIFDKPLNTLAVVCEVITIYRAVREVL